MKDELRDGKWASVAAVLGHYSKEEVHQLAKALFGTIDSDTQEDVMERTVSG